jgi:hypothetical protein
MLLHDKKYHIGVGPDKHDFMTSLSTGSLLTNDRFSVTFQVHNLGDIKVCINGASREDGSGESWNFEAMTEDYKSISGTYSTRYRRGHFKFMKSTR